MKEKKLKRGPKPKPASEIKVPIKIWVKKKHAKEAQKLVDAIALDLNCIK